MLLKGVQEVEAAPDRRAAAEMILIRLCHVADMPPPGELLRRLTEGGAIPTGGPGGAATVGSGGGARAVANGAPMMEAAPRTLSYADVVALAGAKRDVMLYAHLRQSVHLVRFAPPVIEFRPTADAPRDLSAKLAALAGGRDGQALDHRALKRPRRAYNQPGGGRRRYRGAGDRVQPSAGPGDPGGLSRGQDRDIRSTAKRRPGTPGGLGSPDPAG